MIREVTDMSQNFLNQDAPDEAQFARHSVVDEQHQGMVVGTFEYPHGWQARSQVVWNFENTSYAVTIYGAAFNPNGTESFEFLPIEPLFWLDPPNYMFTQGQKYKGPTFLYPMGGLDALVKWAIPKYRGNRQNLHVIEAVSVPNLAQLLRAEDVLKVQHEGVRARVGYVENGLAFEEDFYACWYWLPPMTGQQNWGLTRLFCFRAARGQLDAMRKTLWRVYTSGQDNPQWGQLSAQIIQQLRDEHAAYMGGVMTRLKGEAAYRKQQDEYFNWQQELKQQQLNASYAAEERKRQQEQARASYTIEDARGDVLMGRTAVDDPSNQYGDGVPHYDYGYHEAHWTDKMGNWIDTHDVNYDPNSDPERHGQWFRVQERKVGD
jgi:hypothetical protein